jgi:hypothetical protein
MTERFGGGIYTYTGQIFFPLDPRAEEVRTMDIIQGLALKCRWSAQCHRFYSIAEHSVRVANIARALAEEAGLTGLALTNIFNHGILHDAHEAYIVDMPSPIKAFITGWKDIEDKIQNAILDYYGLDRSHGAPYVKYADLMLLVIEHNELFPKPLPMDDVFHGRAGKNLWPTYPEIPACAREAAMLPYNDSGNRIRDVLNSLRKEAA